MKKILFIILLACILASPANAQFRELFQNAVSDVWGEAGKVGYREAAGWMRRNNHIGVKLNGSRKEWLRPAFKGLVDKVRVSYGATMLEEIGGPGGSIPMDNSLGQTYCKNIYIKARYIEGDLIQLVLLAHEMTHAWQCQDYGGGLDRFGFNYFREFYRAGQSYEDNKLEVDAYDFEAKFARKLIKKKSNSSKKRNFKRDRLIFSYRP